MISLDTTINVLLARYPATAAILNAYGVDTCCGGNQSLRDAAADASADVNVLHAMLEAHAVPWNEQDGQESTA
jgi:iron-sulfur cluster repair protein YtfE (RIC family)